jgi:hypothetical protein
MVLGAGFLFLYQRVGSRTHEVVNKMLHVVSGEQMMMQHSRHTKEQ